MRKDFNEGGYICRNKPFNSEEYHKKVDERIIKYINRRKEIVLRYREIYEKDKDRNNLVRNAYKIKPSYVDIPTFLHFMGIPDDEIFNYEWDKIKENIE
jgi:hypothetical protein